MVESRSRSSQKSSSWSTVWMIWVCVEFYESSMEFDFDSEQWTTLIRYAWYKNYLRFIGKLQDEQRFYEQLPQTVLHSGIEYILQKHSKCWLLKTSSMFSSFIKFIQFPNFSPQTLSCSDSNFFSSLWYKVFNR